MKKLMSILLCCLMILGMAACGGGDKPGGGSAGDGGESRDTVKIGIDGDCGTLDPYLISGSYLNVMYNYAEPLWSYDGVTDGFASDFILAESVDTISAVSYTHLKPAGKIPWNYPDARGRFLRRLFRGNERD